MVAIGKINTPDVAEALLVDGKADFVAMARPLVADPDRGGAGLFLSQLKRDYVPKKGQEERPLIGRPALHLETVQLQHPATGEPLLLTTPLARDFGVALKYLRRYAA